jgi:hypothetical protein
MADGAIALARSRHYKFDELESDGAEWLKAACSLVNVTPGLAGNVSHTSFLNRPAITKDVLAKYLADSMKLVNRQNMLISHLREQAQVLKTNVITCQDSVITLQNELIGAKDQQLHALQTAVVATVEDTVKTEIQSYSEAIKASQPQIISSAAISEDSVKSLVKQVVAEEDRSRNLMMFCLAESNDEQLCDEVNKVFEQLGEKPKIEVCRLGKKSSSTRPVKVTLSSSTFVQQILSKARNLRQSEDFKHIFLSPDRSVEERALHKQLVMDLKKKKEEEPGKRHFIKGGQLCSVVPPHDD